MNFRVINILLYQKREREPWRFYRQQIDVTLTRGGLCLVRKQYIFFLWAARNVVLLRRTRARQIDQLNCVYKSHIYNIMLNYIKYWSDQI